jgi:hypothetical protein
MSDTQQDAPATTGANATGTTDAPGVTEQAGEAAKTAADEGKHVAAAAGQEAQKIAAEAKQQGAVLLGEARDQLVEQSRAQRDHAVQALSSLGDDLERMSGHAEPGLATDLVRQASERVRGISQHLEGREPAELLDDVRDFARRKPGVFLLGALAAGVVAGRMTRGARKAMSEESGAASSGQWASAADAPSPAAPRAAGTPTRTTPSAPAMASFPPDQPGRI